MSNSRGPSTCRRSARSKNVFESSESFCSGPYDSKNIVSSSGHSRCPVDSGSLSDNSPDKVKRKKRRKTASDLNIDNRGKTIKKRVIEHKRLRKSYEELIKVKLKDSRIPIVLLDKLDDLRLYQPKLEVERREKFEERIQLPGLTIPAKVDPKILKYDVVVKINKRQTESLIEVSKKRLQRQSSTSDNDERREGESACSVADSDFNKCAERLTDKLESYSSDNNECKNNQFVSNNRRKYTRASIDKSNNTKLPKRLRGANSRFSLSSTTEESVGDVYLENSKISKSFVHSNKRVKRNSVDQINEKNRASFTGTEPKCIENTVEESGKSNCQSSGKGVKKYFKNSTKVVRKNSQNVTDNSDQKCLGVSVDTNEKIPLLSFNTTAEKLTEIACEKNGRISKNIVKNNTRRTRNFTNKIERHFQDSVETGCSEASLEQRDKRFCEKPVEDLEDGSESQIQNQDTVARKVAENDSLNQNDMEINPTSTENSVEECRKRLSKKLDKIDDCLHNETENNKKITRKHDDKNEIHSDSLIETRVNLIENFVEEHKNLSERINETGELYTIKQTDSTKRSTRNTSDKNNKNIENTQENYLDRTQSFKESSKIKSQNIEKNIQKCSKNSNENVKKLSKNTEKSLQLVEENSENHSKNFENKVKKVSRKSILHCVEEKNDLSKKFDKVENICDINVQSSVKNINGNYAKNFTDKVEQLSQKSTEKYSKNFNNKFSKVLKIPIENNKLILNNVNANNEIFAGTSTNCLKTVESSVAEQTIKHLDVNPPNTVTKNNTRKNKRIRRKLVGNINGNNTSLITEDSIEKHNERLTENLNKNINVRSKTQIELIRKRTRRLSSIEHSEQHKLDEQHSNTKSGAKICEKVCDKIKTNLKEPSKTQTEIIKKIRRKTSLDKNAKISSENLISDNLESLQSSIKKYENEVPQESFTNDNESKMVTRNSSYIKYDKRPEKIQQSNTNSVQGPVEEKATSSKKSNKSFKHLRKMSIEDFETDLSLDQHENHLENSLKSKLSPGVNTTEDNNKELSEESDKNLKDDLQIQNENKIITKQSSHHEPKKHTENLEEGSNVIHNLIQENSKELLNVSQKHLNELTINPTEGKIIARKSLLVETERQSDNTVNNDLESTTNLITQENEILPRESHKSVKIDSIQTENPLDKNNSSINKCDEHIENSIDIKTNCEQDEVNKDEKQLPEESRKHIKNCFEIQSEHKMVTRNSLLYKYENQDDNLLKSELNRVQNDVSKNEEKVPEDLQESIVENKAIVKNSSSYKNCNNLIKDKSICVQNGIHKDEENFAEELYRNIKEFSKNAPKIQVEDNKKASRKSSSDKITDNFIKKNSDWAFNNIDKNQEKPAEELHKVIKDCSKSQIENNKRVTRKSSSDKHERHIDDLIATDSTFTQNYLENKKFVEEQKRKQDNLITVSNDSSQNPVDKINEILFERLNNKENSKIQIEVTARITKSTSIKNDIPSKNTVENTMDCAQILIEESKDTNSENVINNIKVFSKNTSDNKNVKKNSDKISDVHVENFLENNTSFSQNLVDEISEKESLERYQSCLSQSKEFIENNKIIKEESEKSVIESNLEKTQNILDSIDKQDTTTSEENKNNLIDNSSFIQKSFDKVYENTTNNSHVIENMITAFTEGEELSKSSNESFKSCSETLTEDKSIFNNMNNFTENNDTCMPISFNAYNESESNNDTEVSSGNLIENIKSAQNLATAKSENLSEVQQFFKKNNEDSSTNKNKEPVPHLMKQTKEVCSNLQISSEDDKNNECEDFFEEFSVNATSQIDNNLETLNITRKSEKLNEPIDKIIEIQTDNCNETVIENTKTQEDVMEDITEIRAEDLDDSIRNSFVVLTESSTITTSLSFDKSNEIIVENLTNDYNTNSTENLINKIHTNDSQNFRNGIQNNLISSMENIDFSNNSVNSKPDVISSENNVENNSKLDKTAIEQSVNSIKNINSAKISYNSVHKSENTIDKNILKTIRENISNKNKTGNKLKFINNQENPVNDQEAFARERRKITLMELKKKCTENLGNRQAMSHEVSRREVSKTLPSISTNNSVDDTALDSSKNSTESTSDNVSENEDNCSDSLFEDIETNENSADRLTNLNTPEHSNLSKDCTLLKEGQCHQQKAVRKYQPSFLEQNADFSCKDCDEYFDSNRELNRHTKIKHRERLVIKITKTNVNKHVTHMVEPVLKRRDEQFEQLDNENTDYESRVSVNTNDEKKMEQTEERQDSQITEGDIKIIVKKESGSKNSHVVKEIKITPKSGDYGTGGSSHRMSTCSPGFLEIGQPVKRRPGRPRKYPIFTGAELIEKQLAAATIAVSTAKNEKVPTSNPAVEKSPPVQPVEPIIVEPNILFNNHENVTIENSTTEKEKWVESEDSSLAKMLGVKRKRRLFSPESEKQSDDNILPPAKKYKQAVDVIREEEEEAATEPDFCTKYRITKELVVRLTKLDSVPKISKEFNANVNNNVGCNDDEDSASIAENRLKKKTESKAATEESEDDSRKSIKTAIKLNLENNNNINDIEKCLTVSSSPRRMAQKTRNGDPEVSSNVGGPEVSQPQSLVDDNHEAQRATKHRSDTTNPPMSKANEGTGNSMITHDNNKNFLLEAQLIVTPRRQTIDKAEADESQKAKLLMLMNATTPYEAMSKMNTTVVESPQPPTMQLQPQQFCILFIPDALYGSESALNKDITPTATIVNFQPVPDAEMANRSLIYTPTTPTKISIDEHARSYVCTTCTQVLDMIGRLEASLGMTEEDKSAIKCPYCSNHFQSLFYLEYHVMQEHLKCENEKQCRHSRFNSLRIPSHEAASEFEIYITFALKCRSCYDIFNTVLQLNDHVMHKHKTLVRLRPSLSPAAVEAVCTAYPGFARKNGARNSAPVFQCPSDCVCRIGIRSSDTPLQRQQMLKRCPHVMRRLEKIESAAYEVYTCTLCKSTFLMKDEVVDHLMKMHEVSCKFPCYTCLTSFRSLQMQENHRCSETTLQDLDKILSIAILPTNVGGKDNNKYLEREDSSTDEYGVIKTAGTNQLLLSPLPFPRNGFKRKNYACIAALEEFLGAESPKTPKLNSRKSKRICPKCKKRFSYRKSLHDHIIYEHILKGDGQDGPKKAAIELLKLVNEGKANGQRAQELTKMLVGHTDDDGIPLKDLTMMDEQENWEEVGTTGNESIGDGELVKCTRCKTHFRSPGDSGNLANPNRQHLSSPKSRKIGLCESCENSRPKTRRQQLQIIHPFACKKCDDTFPTSIELKCHKHAMHPKNPVEDNFHHTCDICKKAFTMLHMLEKHRKLHRECILDSSIKPEEEDDEDDVPINRDSVQNSSKESEANHSLDSKTNSSARRDSSDSSSAGTKEPQEQPLNCTFCEEICSSKVSLKNHLKREHGRRASICQFCNGLLIDTSEVRHMLDYHIVPSKSNPRHDTGHKAGLGGPWSRDEAGRMREDVEELVRTLGKHRLQSLMMYHDFEGKCNNAIMRCPICPELFATRESCRFHYVWIHDDNCLLCDETFRSGSSACQHKVNAHTSTASYLWCIQRLVTAIVSTLRLDPNQASHTLYQILATKLEEQERVAAERESMIPRCPSEKGASEETASATERFLEEVVLSEDQLPDSSNIIEVVIGKEDSEDDLLSMLNLSPNYESCEQHRLPNAGVAPPEEEDDEETIAAATAAPTTPPATSATITTTMTTMTAAVSVAGATTTSPVVENYVTSGVCKYRLENDEEQLVLVVTDEDLVTFKDDIGSLAERISTTCDSLTLEEITEMLRAYFENVSASMNVNSSGGA